MRFQPKTDKELAVMNLLPEGEYDFEVFEASDAVSTNSNEMIKLKLKVWAPDGSERHVYDYLLEAMAHKLRHFAVCVGLDVEYVNGTLKAVQCVGRVGRVKLIIQKDKTGAYPDKNAVKDYVVKEKIAAKAVEPAADSPEDDVPF